ncbi:hypothetical protein BGY98DRAFT_997356 [Russula aff. rugulosa BPL654]|nr:hypothetical protein BGY98DRAFT_997356 [Russula aff. rugulosa BPL654]
MMFTLTLFWLGVIETKRPELFPRFLQVDLAPSILIFLRRPGSVSLVSISFTTISKYFFFNDGLAAPVLAFSTSICMFCVQCMRVIWPRVFTDPMRHNLMSIID